MACHDDSIKHYHQCFYNSYYHNHKVCTNRLAHSDETVQAGEEAFLVVARLPGITVCENTVRNQRRLGKVDHPHICMAAVVQCEQGTTNQLTRPRTNTNFTNIIITVLVKKGAKYFKR